MSAGKTGMTVNLMTEVETISSAVSQEQIVLWTDTGDQIVIPSGTTCMAKYTSLNGSVTKLIVTFSDASGNRTQANE